MHQEESVSDCFSFVSTHRCKGRNVDKPTSTPQLFLQESDSLSVEWFVP